jgi:hypothetical protein
MALALTCACGARFEVDEVWAGKTITCPDCSQPVVVPSLPPALPVSPLALASTVLALVGAFTLVGSLAAILVGIAALVHVTRQREQVSGFGFAGFGIALGIVGTTFTVIALRSPDLLGLGHAVRSSQWADKVDTRGPLEVEGKGMRLTRPSRAWGVVKAERRFGHGVVDALRSRQQAPDLLLMQTARFAFVDVTSDQKTNPRSLEDYQALLIEELKADRSLPAEPFEERPANTPRITDVQVRQQSPRVQKGNVQVKECVLDVRCGDQNWTLLVRLQMAPGNKLYTLRGYVPRRNFDKPEVEAELRQVLDSFALVP